MKETWKIDCVNSDSNIDFRLHLLQGEEQEHDHQFMEIAYIEKGNLIQYVNGVRYECHEGDFLFFYVGDSHKMIAEEGNEAVILNLIFHPDLFSDMLLQKFFPIDKRIETLVNVPNAERKNLKSIFSIIQNEDKRKGEGYIYVMHSLLQSLIAILLRYGYRKESFDERAKQIMDIVDADCTLSVSDVAKKCAFCNNHLERIFKKSMGITVGEYIVKKRVQKAYDLITSTDMPVERVMESINLSNKTYFYNIFKKYTGKTPGEIRKK